MLTKAQQWLLARDRNPRPVYQPSSDSVFPVAYVFRLRRLTKPDVWFLMKIDTYCKVESFVRICTY